MSIELKPCPFCGELPRTEVSVTKMGGGEDHVDFTIHCANCGTEKTVRLTHISVMLKKHKSKLYKHGTEG